MVEVMLHAAVEQLSSHSEDSVKHMSLQRSDCELVGRRMVAPRRKKARLYTAADTVR